MLTVKLLQTKQKMKILGSESRVHEKWQTAAIILEIFDSNLETGRYGPKSGVSRIIRIIRIIRLSDVNCFWRSIYQRNTWVYTLKLLWNRQMLCLQNVSLKVKMQLVVPGKWITCSSIYRILVVFELEIFSQQRALSLVIEVTWHLTMKRVNGSALLWSLFWNAFF